MYITKKHSSPLIYGEATCDLKGMHTWYEHASVRYLREREKPLVVRVAISRPTTSSIMETMGGLFPIKLDDSIIVQFLSQLAN